MGHYGVAHLLDRFWSKVHKTDTCWLWTGSTNEDGYGRFNLYCLVGHNLLVQAHRFAYALLVAPILPGWDVLHRCDTPACVNPDHLFLGLHTDNMKDMWAKGRHCKVRGHQRTAEGRFAPGPCLAERQASC